MMQAQQTHFGIAVRARRPYGLRIDRDSYARINKRSSTYLRREDADPEFWEALSSIYEDEEHRILTDEWCESHQARALENFDLNMGYFASLDHEEFDAALQQSVAKQRGMKEVTDLNRWEGVGGLYVMVLDDFCQAYVGVSSSGIMERVRQHWTRQKQFDRLLWGDVTTSILSIDSFRALDTTRIFAARVSDPWSLENKVIDSFPAKFLLNRIAGGRADLLGFVSKLGANIVKTRDLRQDSG